MTPSMRRVLSDIPTAIIPPSACAGLAHAVLTPFLPQIVTKTRIHPGRRASLQLAATRQGAEGAAHARPFNVCLTGI